MGQFEDRTEHAEKLMKEREKLCKRIKELRDINTQEEMSFIPREHIRIACQIEYKRIKKRMDNIDIILKYYESKNIPIY
jgi:hypothetical protein